MNEKYKVTIEQINNLLIISDPIGLIQGGAPKDEYIKEAQQIMELLHQSPTLDSLPEGIYSIFVKAFDQDTAGEKEKYVVISKQLEKLIEG